MPSNFKKNYETKNSSNKIQEGKTTPKNFNMATVEEEGKYITPQADLSKPKKNSKNNKENNNTSIIYKNEKYDEKSNEINKEKSETKEWLDILKSIDLSPNELERFSKNTDISKIIDGIELLNRVVMEKNMHIRLLVKENDDLNVKNTSLNNENISLSKTIFELKTQVKNLIKEKQNLIEQLSNNNQNINAEYLNTNVSMANNTSRMDNDGNQKIKKKGLQILNDRNNFPIRSIRINNSFSIDENNKILTQADNFENKYTTTEIKNEDADDSNIIEVEKNEEIFDQFNTKSSTNKNIIKKDNRVYSKTLSSSIKSSSNSGGHDSVIDMKNPYKNNYYSKIVEKTEKINNNSNANTLESCTSSEFRNDLSNHKDNSGFISNTRDLDDLAIEIGNTKM